jgi:hypothetical protein
MPVVCPLEIGGFVRVHTSLRSYPRLIGRTPPNSELGDIFRRHMAGDAAGIECSADA